MSTAYITTFAAKLVNQTSIKLTWTGSYSSASVYQSTDRKKTYTALTEYTEASSYTITSLTPNTVYFFYIIPYDSTGTEGSKKDTFITTPYNIEITSFYAGYPGMTTVPLYWDGIYYNIRLKYKRYDQSDDYITEIYPITGVPSYIVTGLDVDTSYNFQIIPYDLNDFSGTSSDIIYTKTDYLAYVGNIYLGTVTSSTINVSWDGWFSYAALQYSTDNVTFDTKSSVYTSNGGSYTFKRLDPITEYYFRVVPYDEYYNVGTPSTSVSGETLAGFKTVSTTTVSYNSAVLTWDGSYSYVEVYQSSDGGTTYDLIDTITYSSDKVYSAAGLDDLHLFELTSEAAGAMDLTSAVGEEYGESSRGSTVSLSYTVDNLSTSTTYYFYLLPYYNGVLGTSSEIITVITDFNPDASFSVGTPTMYSIPLVFSTDGVSYPYYTYCHIELSTDNSTYYDVSYIYSVPTVSSTYTYYITDYSGAEVALSPNYTYYFRVTPYSNYGTAGATTYYGSQATLGNIDISTFDVSLVNEVITLNWSGYFKSTYVQYTTDDFTGATDISSVLVYRSADYADDTTELISSSYTASSLSTSQTYYFRLKPVNYNGDIGAASASRYNASISGVYLSNISSTGLTVNWTGTYSTVTVQTSTDGSTYSNVSGATDISGSSVDITTTTSSVKYYRIIPYSSNGDQGATSSAAYIPVVSSPTLSVTDVSTVSVSWSGTTDYAEIVYSTDNSTYTTATTGVTSPASVSFYGMDASNQTYYFKVVPYGHGYPTSTAAYDVSGVSSSVVYNATISTAYSVAQTGSSIYNSLKVYYKGTYAGLYIYYDVSYIQNYDVSYIQIAVANSGSSLKNTTIPSLFSNTTYYFKLVPYNSNANNGLYYPVISGTTSSLLTGLNLEYNASNSTSSSVRLTWSYNNYYYIQIYNSAGTLQGTYYSTTTSADISSLAANTAYDFYAKVYDTTGNSETTSNVTTYTSASSANLNMTYVTSSASGFSINPKKVILSWDNSGYYSIAIQNTTNSSSTTTYYSSDGTTSYDSFSAGEGNLVQNTYYTYTFTLKNAYGTSTTFTKKVDTLGTISSFDISSGGTFTSSQIPIEFTGIYNYVIVDVSDGVTRGNTYIYGIGSGSSSVYNSYNLTASNSVISQANKTYWITVYPVNDASDVGLASSTYSAKTLGKITRFYSPGVLDNSSIAVYWDGSYAGVTLESATNSSFSTNYVGTRISDATAAGGAGSGGYTYNGLQPNTKYYFRITPINQPLSDGNDVSGTAVTNDVSGTTLGVLTSLYTSAYYDVSATVAFDGSFASIDISTNGVKTTYTTARTTGVDISNLTPGATYVVTTTVRNSAGATVAGNSISFTTRSKITGFSAAAVDSSSISVAWSATGALSYVTLIWNTVGGTYGGTDSSGTYYTSPAYITGLVNANKRYYFQIIPTSSVGDGYKVMDASDVTWGKLNSFYVDTSNITSTSIPIKWDGSFNRLIIQQSLDGVTYLDASSVMSYDSSGTTLPNLYNNTMYYIRAVPISDASAAGTTTATITGTTLAYIGNVYASDITSSTFKVNVDVSASSYSSFYVVNTTANKTSEFVTYPDYSITFSDLSANTSFDVIVYAYNYNETDGSGIVVLYGLSGTTTLATITGAATANVFTDLSSAYYSITLYGYYTSFKLQYTIDDTTYDTSYVDYGSKITVSDLSANTTYTYTAYANNKSGGAGTDVTKDFTVTTLGSTPSFNAKSSPDYSQVNSITFDIYRGDYAAVRVKTSTTVDMSSGLLYTVDISDSTILTLGNVYIQTDLSVNTKYYFNSTPINSAGALGNPSTTLPLATLGNLTAVSLTSPSMIGTDEIPVSWSGAYNTILLEYANAEQQSYSTFATYSNSTTPTSTIISANVYVTGLSPNTAYYFRTTPYSLDSLAGTTLYIQDVSAMTLATIITSTITTTIYDTSAVIAFDGSFSKVRIYSSPTSLDKTYTWALGGISTGTDISGLTANTSYTFYYVPYNSNNVTNPISVGTPVYSSTFYTQPRIASKRTVVTDTSSVSIAWVWSGSATSAKTQIETSTDGTTYTYNTIALVADTSNTITNLEANQRYYFALTPKAQSDTSGYTVYITDTSATTLGNITTLSNTATSDLSASFSLTGAFSGYKVYNPATKAYTSQTATNSSSISLYDLSANTSYVFSFYPQNSYGTYNAIAWNSDTITTLGNVTTTAVSMVRDSSSIRLAWTGYYTSMNIYTSTSASSGYTLYMNTTASNADISGLAWNTRYYFNLVPVNSAGVTSFTYNISDASATTLGNLSAVSATVISDTSATFSVAGTFSGVRAYNSATSAYTEQVATNSTTMTLYNLAANTTYSVPFYPKNSYGTYSLTGIPVSITTLGNITAKQPNEIVDTSAITIGWKGNFASVNVAYSTDDSTYTTYSTGVTGNSLYIPGLSPNKRYYFRVIPVNSASTAGLSYYIKDASAVTMGNVVSMNTSYVGYSELSFNLYGNFSGIKAHNTTASVTTYHTGTNYVGTNTLSGLSPNTAYTYRFYALNSFGYYSSKYYEKIHYTTPNISSASATPSSSSQLSLSWTFTGSSNTNVVVHVYTSNDGSSYTYNTKSTSGSTTASTTNTLSANTKYYIRLIPKGYSDTSGSNFDISGYTYGSISQVSYSSLDASSVKITATGTFTKARVYNSAASFNTTYTA